eukprot:2461186-Pleurochrysis_carterae.AAC.1
MGRNGVDAHLRRRDRRHEPVALALDRLCAPAPRSRPGPSAAVPPPRGALALSRLLQHVALC